MTTPSWVTPKTRLFLVAYEGADGRPYAVALSDHGVAARLARRFGGEVIDTLVDNHADMAADVDSESGLPSKSDRAEDQDGDIQILKDPEYDYESNLGRDRVTGIWEGEEAYPNNAVTLPLPTTPEEELEAAIEALLRGVDACLRGGTALLSVTRPAEAIREAFAKWKEAR